MGSSTKLQLPGNSRQLRQTGIGPDSDVDEPGAADQRFPTLPSASTRGRPVANTAPWQVLSRRSWAEGRVVGREGDEPSGGDQLDSDF